MSFCHRCDVIIFTIYFGICMNGQLMNNLSNKKKLLANLSNSKLSIFTKFNAFYWSPHIVLHIVKNAIFCTFTSSAVLCPRFQSNCLCFWWVLRGPSPRKCCCVNSVEKIAGNAPELLRF